ncbi:hypothetical protein, partial [Vibrio cholerae]|uniref:hypothetical protein n=2 Tax=Vibrio cholerae TaxID=666 RepID=UPI00226FAF55
QVEKIAREVPEHAFVRVCHAAGTFAYLKKAQITSFFKAFLAQMELTGYHWAKYSSHGELLRNLKEVGGLKYCPQELLEDYCSWLCLCYIGEPGGYGAGYNRNVFYSNSGAPLSLEILQSDKGRTLTICERLENSKEIKRACSNPHVARRYEKILEELE